jgi:hypothetical protein
VNIETYESCLVMMLVEGTEIEIMHADGSSVCYHYAETFVIPAAAESCTIVNKGITRARVLKAFLKP